jgi:hypothetical protein
MAHIQQGNRLMAGSASMGAAVGDTVYTPIWSENFNTFSNGMSLTGGVVFRDAGRTVADTSIRYGASGASAKMSIRTGDGGGFGNWGGIRALSTPLGKGSEIWVRWRQYWPTAFTFSATPWMKFLRFRTEVGGVNNGYLDLYVEKANGSGVTYRTIKEVQDVWAEISNGAIPRDQWITYEVYAKLDNVSVNGGGTGRMRVWIDGVNVQDRTNITTLTNASALVPSIYFFTYWNNEAPPNNDTYFDDVVVATSASPPTATDSGGRIFIGTT